MFGGLGNSESKTRTDVRNTNNAISASDQAIVNADRSRTNIEGGVRISADPEVLLSALDQVTAQANIFSSSLTDIFSAGTKAQLATALAGADAQKSFLDSTFDQLSSLAKSQQTEGESDRNRIVLYVSMAALAAVAAIFIFGKK